MTAGSYLGVLLTLGFVLALVGLAAKLLRRFAPGSFASRGRMPMEVVQRLALSPRQGIAVVRVGERFHVISTGDGGVRALYELEGEELEGSGMRVGAVDHVADDARHPTPDAPSEAWVDEEAVRSARRNAIIDDDAEVPAFLTTPAKEQAAAVSPRPSAAALRAPRFPLPASRDFASIVRTALKNNGVPLALLLLSALASPATAQQPAPAPPAAAPQPTAQPTAPAPAGANAVRAARPRPAQTPPASRATPPASQNPVATTEQVVERLSPQLDLRVGGGAEQKGLRLSGTVGTVVMMGILTLIPMLLLMMTSFTRIFIVLQFLKQALGTQSAPPAQLVAGLSLLLTGFVMAPTFSKMNETALQPWLNGQMEQSEMLDVGAQPFKQFMLRQTRPSDVRAFIRMSGRPAPARAEEIPLITLTSAFVTSELRTAFQIGFALFLPFIVIDIVVSSVLMSMGMMMLPPAMIALPFKLLLFVLVDGWSLVMQSLVASFK